jgi:hypothetical protein
MSLRGPGSATDMEHEFKHPARVVEISRDDAREDDADTDEFLPKAPPATDDGTPIHAVRRRPTDAR